MEIPAPIKELYRHWDMHTLPRNEPKSPAAVFDDLTLFYEISDFISERINIWQRRTNGHTPPYTEDTILAKYRFCNIFREFDRQTIDFHTLLNPMRADFELWLMNMFLCRMIARQETIANVGLLSFNAQENQEWYKRLIASPRPRYGNAYVFPVSTIQKSKFPTRELFLAKYLPSIIPDIAHEIMTWRNTCVHDGVHAILSRFGFHLHFLWTEALIDVAYQFPTYIDLFGQFPIGPGSAPTFRRINPAHEPSLLAQELAQISIHTNLTVEGKPLALSAENWEGIGCEFRKYTNLRSGFGRKRLYSSAP